METYSMAEIILQVIYTVLSMIGCWYVIKKQRKGWMLWLIATPFMLTYLVLVGGFWMIPAFIAYGCLDIHGFIKWGKR